jgi:raffinose/stachyose/melibiose transport system permease protein
MAIPGARPAVGAGWSWARLRRRAGLDAYPFILPAALAYLVFELLPFVQTLWLGFHAWDGVNPARWVGLKNYAEAYDDPIFWRSLQHNLVYMTMSLTLPITTGFVLALFMAEVTRGRSVFRVGLFTPHVLSAAVVGILFRQIYDPDIGILNSFLRAVGLGGLARAWLADSTLVLPAINLASSWHAYGFAMVIYMAALQTIDPHLYDAARIDGANWLRLVRHVTVPGVRNATTMLLSFAILGSMTAFGMIWVMTRGGPFFASEVLATYIYKRAFEGSYMGYASALSTALALIVMVAAAIFIRLRERGD